MSETVKPAPPRHLNYLDSARGIAAIMVMVYHYINWKYDSVRGMIAASIVFNGADAVSFFFVLSGFVLSYQYIVLDTPLDIRKFFVTRFFRLWPAFFLTVLLNALNTYRGDLSPHTLFHALVLNQAHFWEEAILIRPHQGFYVPSWTLVVELGMSFFVPFYVALAKKSWKLIYWLFFVYILTGDPSFHFHFVLGVFLSCIFFKLGDPAFKATVWYRFRYVFLFIAAIFFSIRHIDKLRPLGDTYTYWAGYFQLNFFHYTGLASFIFIAAIIVSRNTQKILSNKTLLFVGKISYGIYLMHWVIVSDIFTYWERIVRHFPNETSAFLIMFCFYVVASVIAATVLHYTIELPFIRLGKRIAQRFKPSLVIN